MEPTNPELLLGDARSISGGLWRMVWLAQEAAEALDSRIEDEDLDGLVEAVEVRKTLECTGSGVWPGHDSMSLRRGKREAGEGYRGQPGEDGAGRGVGADTSDKEGQAW